jgi:hypothetical protein
VEATMAREGILQKVMPYDLHGVRWYQMLISYPEAPNQVHQVRLSHDMVYSSPQEGDRVSVETLLSMVTEVRKSEETAG